MLYTHKPEWMPEWGWRAFRTFVQVLAPMLVVFLNGWSTSQRFDLGALAYTVLIPAVSATIAALSNKDAE
jgi:hypothetical protein